MPAVVAGQVRPDLTWRTLQTAHFRVHFTPELEGLARRSAANAEWAWGELAKEMTPPRGMVELVVADNVDYANGYATPFPSNRIVIYARPPMDEQALRLHRDWNEILIAHELAHIFHLDRAKGWWGVGQKLFGRAAPLFPNIYSPSWLIEGLAVHYETKLTGQGRLAGREFAQMTYALARDSVLPSLDALSSAQPHFPGAQVPYLIGSQLFQKGADAGGEGSVRRFVEASSGRLLPWRLDANARAGFGKSFHELYDAWHSERMSPGAGVPAFTRRITSRVISCDPGIPCPVAASRSYFLGWDAKAPRWRDSITVIVAANDVRRTPAVYAAGAGERLQRVTRLNTLSPNVPTPSGALLSAQGDLTDPYSFRTDLYVDGRRITDGLRLSSPDARRRDGAIVAVQTGAGATSLVRLAADGSGLRVLRAGSLDESWNEPRWSWRGDRIAAQRWVRGGRTTIVVMDTTGRVTQEFEPIGDRGVLSAPTWFPNDSALVFVGEFMRFSSLYRGRLSNGEVTEYWNSFYPLSQPDIAPDGRQVAALELRGDGYHLVTSEPLTNPAPVPLIAIGQLPVSPARTDSLAVARPYSAFRSLLPRWWLPASGISAGSDATYGLMTSGRDLVGRHSYALTALLDPKRGQGTGFGYYSWAGLGNPTIDLSGLHDYSYFRIADSTGRDLGELSRRERTYALSITANRPRVRTNSYLSLGAEVEVRDYESDPPALLTRLQGARFTETRSYPAAVVSTGWSNLQRPGLAISNEDGISTSLTARRRFDIGVGGTDVNSAIGAIMVAKSIPTGGFARSVIAARVAYGAASAESVNEFGAGGVSGASLEVIPGVNIGDSRRSFFVRGFGSSTQIGTRAAAGSVELRVPVTRIGRGVGLLPVFFQKLSVNGFADAGAAWCPTAVQGSPICATARERSWLASVGGEIALDAALQYDQLYRFRLGVAAPVQGRDAAPRSATVYFTLGSAF